MSFFQSFSRVCLICALSLLFLVTSCLDVPVVLNQAPSAPDLAIPGTSIFPTLRWTSIDPERDPLTYDVRFGKVNPPPRISQKQSENSYSLSDLQYGTKYFWQIIAYDDQENFTPSDLDSFTTIFGPPCHVTVTSPNSGDNWTIGETQTIRWSSENASSDVIIELWKNGSFN